MHSFTELSQIFEQKFNTRHFPIHTVSLYDPAQYILEMGGKRIRPVCVLMGSELFDEINPPERNSYRAVSNFSLIHDDIMDKAPLRRGMETVHTRYGESTALLAGDVMLVQSYEYLNKIKREYSQRIIHLFNQTAKAVCEGQQLDMDFEKRTAVSLDEYVNMITLKTSLLLAASLQLGAILGGAGQGNQQYLYGFGKNLGIAFQVQDDYLDAFGDPGKFGKQVGGDIISNKKTFLLIHAMEVASDSQKKEMAALMNNEAVHKDEKVNRILTIFRDCKVDDWARKLKDKYLQTALQQLADTAVLSARKRPLMDLATYLLQRES
ncbi:MAG: polyprenyl synthetase family protein [Ferruginibacter sp.]